MGSYLFLTLEGYTFQPGSESCEPDVDNVQLIGIAEGVDQHWAFENLVKENDWLLGTSFDEVYCYELAKDFGATRQEFLLSDARRGAQSRPARPAKTKSRISRQRDHK